MRRGPGNVLPPQLQAADHPQRPEVPEPLAGRTRRLRVDRAHCQGLGFWPVQDDREGARPGEHQGGRHAALDGAGSSQGRGVRREDRRLLLRHDPLRDYLPGDAVRGREPEASCPHGRYRRATGPRSRATRLPVPAAEAHGRLLGAGPTEAAFLRARHLGAGAREGPPLSAANVRNVSFSSSSQGRQGCLARAALPLCWLLLPLSILP
mmetsp:Transcript_104008/g.325033  ORF Transcript_104008/g.325033 Transcript_104008/m.325033 type:complete len:208 (-) Transcript_104008:10-633(-)